MSTVTVLDGAPRAFDRRDASRMDAPAKATLARLRAAAAGLDAKAIVALSIKEFPGRVAMVSSFGSESAVLLHMLSEIDPDTPVLFLNTGKLFGETLRYRDRLQDRLGLGDVRSLAPHALQRVARDPDDTLWSRDTDACCSLRKVNPLRHALEGFDAQITGRKRFQTRERAAMAAVEHFEGRFRFNPLADWSQADLDSYMNRHDLPRHPLVEDGYPSIGCMPCTRRVAPGEGYRDGRWAGLDKDECGIHGLDGDGI